MRPVGGRQKRLPIPRIACAFLPARRAAWATGTAVYQGFRTASRTPPDTPHRHAIRSLPKTLVYRPYGSLLLLFGISRRLFQAIFVEGIAVEETDLPVFADDVGLTVETFQALKNDPQTDTMHQQSLHEAHDRGAFGVPTFFVGDRMFWGNDRLPLLRNFLLAET